MSKYPFITGKEVKQHNSQEDSEYRTAIISGYKGHYEIGFLDSNYPGKIQLALSKQAHKLKVFKSLDTAVAYAYFLGCSFVTIHAYNVDTKTKSITPDDVVDNFLTLLH